VTGWLIDATPFVAAGLAAAYGLHGPAALRALLHGLLTKRFDAGALGLPQPALKMGVSAALHLLLVAALWLSIALAWIGYRIAALPLRGRTVGKWLVGTWVARVDDPTARPTWGQATKRCLLPQAGGLIPLPGTGLLPYLWLLRDARRRGLHDHVAGTIVLQAPRPGQLQPLVDPHDSQT
jgi:uncharacterized RDD family membrane protein YckC